jgi:hypothetical protein
MSIASNYPAIKPSLLLDFSNTEELDSRITFTRASTATYYGTQTAKAEENLLLQSQTFDNASWQKTAATVAADSTAAPDGTSTADTFSASATTEAHFCTQNSSVVAGLAYTMSVFAKAGTTNFLQVFAGSVNFGANVWANFDLSAGTVGTVGSSTTASIISVGSGWYRCVISNAIATSSTLSSPIAFSPINSASATRNVAFDGTGHSIYLWGAQLEQRSAVTAYTVTTTQPITNYIPQLLTAASGVARFDHNPTTFESLGLEIEEQRANLLTYSEQFDNAAWTKSDATVTANTIVSPNGTVDADKLVENTATSTHSIVSGITPTASTAYTGTVYIKAAERQFAFVGLNGGGIVSFASINLSTGAVSVATGTPTVSAASVGNGWYRVSVTATTASTVFLGFDIRISTDGVWANRSYTGNGFNGIFIWGAQMEAGTFSTSYIPTVASQVTRAADAASMTGTNFSSWYNQGEGTLYADWSAAPPVVSTLRALAVIGQSTAGNDIILSVGNNVANYIILSGGASQTNLNPTATSAQTGGKVAAGYKVNDFAVVANNGTASTDALGILPSNPNQLLIGVYGTNPATLCGTIRKIAYYPVRVTNAQLQGLTS